MMRVGVDVGGTFTDFVFLDEMTGRLQVQKTSSTPDNQMRGVMEGLARSSCAPRDISMFLHGTTVATNAVIQKKGCRTGLITTKGFRDVLKIRRTTRGKLYDVQWDPPEELVPRRYRLEIDERTDAFGHILKPVNRGEVLAAAEKLVRAGMESVAVVFINSYANPANEVEACRIIKEAFPDLFVVNSSQLLREWREFERTSTAVVAAYVGPLLKRYLGSMMEELGRGGYQGRVLVMLSNGGVAPADQVEELAPRSLLSGPAAAVIAAREIGRLIGEENLVSIDIGGTSTDVAMVYQGELLMSLEQEIEFGTIVHLPVIDVSTIGAGGGTIAWIDRGGVLQMGPQSAGADPGPVCYGKGGTEPTLTDANVVLGRLNPGHLLGGQLPIDRDRALKAIEEKIAQPLGLDTYAAARGMVEVLNQNIANAIRKITVQKGYDPREFALFCCGGAGPLQAAEIARELSMKAVIVPPNPGVTSALGLLLTDIRHDYVTSYIQELNRVEAKDVEAAFASMEEEGKRQLAVDGVKAEDMVFERSVDLRYLAQTHELTVSWPYPAKTLGAEAVSIDSWRRLCQAFHDRHQQEFGYAAELDEPLEIVNLRVAAIGKLSRPELAGSAADSRTGAIVCKPKGNRLVYFKETGNGPVPTPVYWRQDLVCGDEIFGPAVIEQFDSTIVILPGQSGKVDAYGNIIIKDAI